MKDEAQLAVSIDRFRRGFWNREQIGRPPVAIAADRTWLPINYLRRPFFQSEMQPADIDRRLVRTDYEDSFAQRPVVSDDLLPYAAAWRGVPWLEAICGCAVRYSTGSLAPGHWLDQLDELTGIEIPVNDDWLNCLFDQTAALLPDLPPDCWVSPSILRGASDVLAAMRGMTNFFLDVIDQPHLLAAAAERIAQLHLNILERHFKMIEPKMGGYGHIYGYWAPGKTTVLQEDAMGLCHPQVFKDIFMPVNVRLVEQLGPYVFFHLHSTGYQHYQHVLDIPGLAGLELTVELNGPSLSKLAPVLREILERSRLILFVDAHFDELPATLKQLPRDGLYLIVSDKFIPTEAEIHQFLVSNW